MEILIKLDKRLYKNAKHHTLTSGEIDEICDAIANCTPLPKGHGRLIDAKEYEDSIRKHYFDYNTVIRCTEIALHNAETIIEADKENEDKR